MFQRMGSVLLLLFALAVVLRSLAFLSVNILPLPLVLGSGIFTLAGGLLLALLLVVGAGFVEWRRLRVAATPPNESMAGHLAVVALAVSWLAFLTLAQPFQRLWFDLALGLGAGLFALLILAQRWISARWPRIARGLELTLFALCAGIFGLEFGLRTWANAYPSPMFARVGGGSAELVHRFRCKPGQVRFGFPCNSDGFYDEEFRRKQPGEPARVVAIGDSFGLGAVPHAWNYTTIVEELGGLRVDNMGVAGIGPPEYLSLLIEEALPLEPDLILISVFVGNDLNVEDVLADLPDAGLRRLLQRDQALLFVVPERMARVRRERRAVSNAQGSNAHGSGAGEAASEMDRAAAARAFPWVADPLLEEPSLSEETFLRMETKRARDICARDPASLGLLQSSLRAAREVAGDTPLVVMLIPDEFQVEDELWKQVSAQLGVPLERDRAQRLLRAWLDAEGIAYLDLLPVLRAVEPLENGHRHLYHALDTHFNARGNEVTARALQPFLVEHLPAGVDSEQ